LISVPRYSGRLGVGSKMPEFLKTDGTRGKAQPKPAQPWRQAMTRFSVAAMALGLGLGLLANGAAAQTRSAKDQLAGAWTLVKWWNVADDGHDMPPPIDGPDMKGSLMFDAGGRYALVIASDRPKWKSPDRMEGTAEENQAAARGTLAYYGTYTVSDTDRILTLHVERSLHPSINGTDQKRFFAFEGDTLKLQSPPFEYPKGTFTGYLIWQRAK
jgi:hypothetical protein